MNHVAETVVNDEYVYERYGHLQTEISTHTISWTVNQFINLSKDHVRIRSDFFRIPALPNYLFYLCLSIHGDKLTLRIMKNALPSWSSEMCVDIAVSVLDPLNMSQVMRSTVMTKEASSVPLSFKWSSVARLFVNSYGTLVIKCSLSIDHGHINTLLNEIHKKRYGKTFEHMSKLSSNELREHLEVLLDGDVNNRVTISVAEVDFYVHRSILCAHSPVFAAMFNHETLEAKQNHIHIDDIQTEIIGEMLKFIYTGSTSELSPLMAIELYTAADKYAMTSLKMRCSAFIASTLSKEFVLEIIVMADQHADEELKNAAIQFLVEKGSDVIRTDEFLYFLGTETDVARSIFLYLVKQIIK